MVRKDKEPDQVSDLRRLAEAILHEKTARFPPVNPSPSPAETQRILHELEVHQIELEMQNDEMQQAQADLAAERERYFDLFELAPVGYCIISEQGLIEKTNLAAASLLGQYKSALLKQPFSRFIVKKDQDIYYLHQKKLLETGEPQACEMQMQKEDGTQWWAHLSAALTQNQDGSPACRVIVSDITMRKKAEEARRESEAQLIAILDATPFPIALVDTEDDKIKFWSRSALALFGHTAPTAAQWYQLAYPDPDYRREVIERWKPCLEKARLTGQAVNTGEYRVSCRDGSVRICELYAAFQADRLIVTFNDITGRKKAEEASRESEVRFRELFNRTSSGIAVYEAVDNGQDFMLVAFNPAAERIEKISRQDILGKRVSEVFPGVKDFGIFNVFQRVWRTAQPEYFPQNIYQDARDTGSWRENWVFKLATGEVVAIYNDISDRMEAAEMLRSSEQNFRTIWETMLQGVVHQAADGKIISMNPAAERILGKSPQDFLGTTSVDQEHATVREDGSVFPGLEHPSMVALQTGQPSDNVVMGVFNPREKGYRSISISAVPLFRSGETTPYQVYTIFDDITERKKTEDALQNSEAQHKTILQTAMDGFWIVDRQGRLLDVNQAYSRMSGYSQQELLAMSIADMEAVESGNDTSAHIRKVIENGEDRFETRHRRKDGSLFNVEISVQYRPREGKLVAFLRDITERKQAEEKLEHSYQKEKEQRQELQEEARARGMFIDILAHEIRTPLTPLVACSAILQETLGSPDAAMQKKLVDTLFNGAQSLKQRLEELLDMGQLSRGTFILHKKAIDVADLVSKTAAQFKPLAEQQSRQFILEIQDGLPVIEADPVRLEQVISNLLSNSVKYSPINSTITLKVSNSEHHIIIEVQDEGKGIAPAEQKKLFDPYHRVMQDTQKYPGIGLGLAICKQIVEAHGGRIGIESLADQNTCFRVEIPVKIGLEDQNETSSGGR